MGSDIADLNNDQLPDIFVADMLPEDNYRQKILKGPDDYVRYSMLIDKGYHYQYMRNTLQFNKGLSKDSIPVFSEVGQMAGVSNTDWSWAPLLLDFDNDGLKDIFITNGFLRDFSNKDFTNYTVSEAIGEAKEKGEDVDLGELISKLPSTKVSNYVFKNLDGLKFKNVTESWGLDQKTVSNAAAYADFDNDGDLDLVVNNLNEPARLYENNSDNLKTGNFVKLSLEGKDGNTFALGAKIVLSLPDSSKIYQEVYYNRGYQSSVEPVLNIGLGAVDIIPELKVIWPGGKVTVLKDVKANQKLQLIESKASKIKQHPIRIANNALPNVTSSSGLKFSHKENDYIDFNNEGLIPYQVSRMGAKAAVGDVNGDGNDDVYFCAARNQDAQLYLGKDDGTLVNYTEGQDWLNRINKAQEDNDALFFDADGDSDLDLYVVSGGNEQFQGSGYYQDRLYLNDGKGKFTFNENALPDLKFSGGVAKAADFDKDGDLDLFIGGRVNGVNYPSTPPSVILRNDTYNKQVHFSALGVDKLINVGMVTDATWQDINKDSWPDLILVGEWMPISIFINEKGTLIEKTEEYGLADTDGWWFSLTAGDYDNDGDIDFLAGNLGENSQFKASLEEPMNYYIQDIDNNGRPDPILSYYKQGKSYPYPGRDQLIRQVPSLKKHFTDYESYARTSMEQLKSLAKLQPTNILSIYTLKSSFIENIGDGTFQIKALPYQLQNSAIQDFEFEDFNNDGIKEVLIAGNLFPFQVNLGKMDASFGNFIKFKENAFQVMKDKQLWLQGDIRDLNIMNFRSGKRRLLVTRDNDRATLHKLAAGTISLKQSKSQEKNNVQ